MCKTWCRPLVMMQWSADTLHIVYIAIYVTFFKVPIPSLLSGSQKSTWLVAFVALDKLDCVASLSTTPNDLSATWVWRHNRAQAHVRGCPPTYNFASEVAPKVIDDVEPFGHLLGQCVPIHMKNRLMVHVDAISPTLHIVLKSDSTTKTMSLSLWHASWNLFPKDNESWIDSSTCKFPKDKANTWQTACWLSCPNFWWLYQTQCW